MATDHMAGRAAREIEAPVQRAVDMTIDVARPSRLGAYVPALDGLRGLAILMVMVLHTTFLQGRTPLDEVVLRVGKMGWAGVDLFFVLSGFLITGILFDSKSGQHYFRNFYARRILRIFPLYYAFLVFVLLVLPNILLGAILTSARIGGGEVWYWTYLSNFDVAFRGAWRNTILDISWSLAIEEQFYLVWPAVVFFFSRRALMATCVMCMAVAFFLRVVLLVSGANAVVPYVLPFTRMDALAAGAWIALAARREGGILKLVRPARIAAPALGLLMLGIFFSQNDLEGTNQVMQTIGYSGLAGLFGAILIWAVGGTLRSSLVQFFNVGSLRMFGKYGYAMYLFHLPLRKVIYELWLRNGELPDFLHSQIPSQMMFYLVSIVTTLLFAILSWQLYEKHFLRLKRMFAMDRKANNPIG